MARTPRSGASLTSITAFHLTPPVSERCDAAGLDSRHHKIVNARTGVIGDTEMAEYALAIGDRNYSSWSLRAWLLFAKFGIAHDTTRVHLDSPEFLNEIKSFAPTRTVPALRLADGTIVWDTLAIAETMAELNPELPFWPRPALKRALARAIVAEMHSGFLALRNDCPMNLRRAYVGFAPSPAVLADVARIETLWELTGFGAGTGADSWLFGDFGIADAFFAPVVARIVTYGLPVGPAAETYCAKMIADPAFRRWRAIGLLEDSEHVDCDLPLPERVWPGPAPLPAHAVLGAEPVNATCPYSGDPVAADSLAEIDGQVIGFCNAFCRDKTMIDAAAWPRAMALVEAARLRG